MNTETLPPRPDCCPAKGSVWQHSKGAYYEVVTVARHSEEPGRWLVVYQPLWQPDAEAWVRSLVFTPENQWPGFLDVLDKEGQPHRFRHVSGPRTWKEGQDNTSGLGALAFLVNRAMEIEKNGPVVGGARGMLEANPNYRRLLRVIRAASETLFEDEPEETELAD